MDIVRGGGGEGALVFQAGYHNPEHVFSGMQNEEKSDSFALLLIMVCDVKTIANDCAIVERLGSRDISKEQKKRLNNAGKRP